MNVLRWVADRPSPLPYATPNLETWERIWIDWIEIGMSDEETWALLFTPEQTIRSAWVAYGKQMEISRTEWKTRDQAALFAD